MGSTTAAAAKLAMTVSWVVNHPALRSIDVVADAPTHLGDQPHRPRAHPSRGLGEQRPDPGLRRRLPAAPDTVLHARPHHRERSGAQGESLEHGQCTPCPAWKKKLTMAGAAPIRRRPRRRRARSGAR